MNYINVTETLSKTSFVLSLGSTCVKLVYSLANMHSKTKYQFEDAHGLKISYLSCNGNYQT